MFIEIYITTVLSICDRYDRTATVVRGSHRAGQPWWWQGSRHTFLV